MFTRSKIQTAIRNSFDSNNKTLDLSGLGLVEVPDEVSKLTHIETLNLDNNRIKRLSNIPNNILTLFASNNIIEKTDGIPTSVIMLYLNNNKLTYCSLKYYNSLIYLSCHNNNLHTIFDIPDSLNIALLCRNKLTLLPDFKNTTILNVSNNQLTNFTIPKNVIEIDISHNNITELRNFPDTLKRIICINTGIVNVSQIDKHALTLNIIGLNEELMDNFMNYFSVKIQSFVRKFLIKKNYGRLLLIKHIDDIGKMPKNINYWALRQYYVNPLCRIAVNGGMYHNY